MFYFGKFLLCNLGWSQTHHFSASVSGVLWLQTYATVLIPLIASLAEYGITKRRVTGHSYEKGYLDRFNELERFAYCVCHHSQAGNSKLYKKEKMNWEADIRHCSLFLTMDVMWSTPLCFYVVTSYLKLWVKINILLKVLLLKFIATRTRDETKIATYGISLTRPINDRV